MICVNHIPFLQVVEAFPEVLWPYYSYFLSGMISKLEPVSEKRSLYLPLNTDGNARFQMAAPPFDLKKPS